MDQNTIAIIWDFDKTLIDGYMQEPIFKRFNVDGKAFWAEVNSLPKQYKAVNVRVNRDTIYLNHMITCAEQGLFSGLSNDLLFALGKELVFYPGVKEILEDLKNCVKTPKYATYNIHVEHYIVSTGLTSMIRGSMIADLVDGIWGCEFIEHPIKSKLIPQIGMVQEIDQIRQPGYVIDNTSKTRAIFEINKGANKFDYIDVNSKMAHEDRRVPFENMIYIADGPSDVPVFSVLQQNKGKTFAIYPKGDDKAFDQVDQLRHENRIDMYAEANYSKGSTAHMWLIRQTQKIADGIYETFEENIKKSASNPPSHIT